MTDLRVGGVAGEVLHGATPQARTGGAYVEVLTFIPPPVMALAGSYVEVLTPRLLPTMGLAGAYLEVLSPVSTGPGSNVFDHTGTERWVYLLTPEGLIAQEMRTA